MGLKNTKWLMPDPHSNSVCDIVIRGEHCQRLWACWEANPGAELGVFVVPPEVAFTPRTRADLHCPIPAIVPYLLQVEAVNLPQALEPPDSTDVLPVQTDSRGGQQLCGSRGWGVLRVSFVPTDPSLPAWVVKVGSVQILTGSLGAGAPPDEAVSSWR